MILWRLLPWQAGGRPTEPGGALWFPRQLQGSGRHDNPDRYGCLYASELPVSTVLEALAPFRGTGVLSEAMLRRAGLPLALAQLELELEPEAELIDLDQPLVLSAEGLHPSEIATSRRSSTQDYASRLFEQHPRAAGLRWWSTLEASLMNLTLYDRALQALTVRSIDALTLEHPATRGAAELLGLGLVRA